MICIGFSFSLFLFQCSIFFSNDNANRLSQGIINLILINYSLIMNFSRFKQCSSNNMRKSQDFPSETHPLTCQFLVHNSK